MPDQWELAHGLNPNDPTDRNLSTLSTLNAGYTNLEFFLNGQDGELANPIPPSRPVPDADTALEQVQEDAKTAVILLNGTLYIQKNNEKYTLSGQNVP